MRSTAEAARAVYRVAFITTYARGSTMIADIFLVHPDDWDYWRWVSKKQHVDTASRPRCPFAGDYHRALRKWEHITRSIVRLHLDECPQRILRWKEIDRRRRPRHRYRELDFVHGSASSPRLFVEIKHRETISSGSSGSGQLRSALAIARQKWPSLAGLCLNVHMGSILGLEANEHLKLVAIGQLRNAMPCDAANVERIPVVWIDSKEVGAYAVQAGLLSESELQHLRRLRELAHNPLQALNNDEADSFGARLGDFWPK